MALVAVLAACTGQRATLGDDPAAAVAEGASTDPTTTAPPRTDVSTDPSTTDDTTTRPATAATSTTPSSSTTSTSSTTTTVQATTTTRATVPGAANPACALLIHSGDSLGSIVAQLGDDAITVDALALENAITDPNRINAEDPLDVCPGNGVDDITGEPWAPPPPPPAPVAPAPGEGSALASGVPAQQEKLNRLFAGTGFPALTVDGDPGRATRRALCAARMALGLPASRDAMEPGGAEEQALMAAQSLSIPSGAPTNAWRWALIDQTCQVTFVGEGSNRIVFLFPTSTGLAEFPTRNQTGARAFRYDPALANGGWHDSLDYPAGQDNPLNGNMYKPIYFDRGQAIHGANNVPPEPRSHGCARLTVADQDALVLYLGLADVDEEMWNGTERIGLTVTVQGEY